MGNNVFRSAYKNKTEKVLRLVDETPSLIVEVGKPDMNTMKKEACCIGQTLLYVAASHGNVELVKELINRGADINALCDCNTSSSAGNKWTPTMVACANGHRDTFIALIEAGADLSVKDKQQK